MAKIVKIPAEQANMGRLTKAKAKKQKKEEETKKKDKK
jgi:hypothetical protein